MKHHHIDKLYIAAFVVILLTYAGCAGGPSSGGQQPDYRFGSEGLHLEFHPDNPYEFYEGDDVTLLFELRNRGTSDIGNFGGRGSTEPGTLFISGFDPHFLNFQIFPSEFFSLEGKDEFDPTGEYAEVYSLVAQRAKLPSQRDRFLQSVQITACYDYHTFATAEICVDPDPHNRRLEYKVCDLGVRNAGAQGHPVVISSIDPRVNDRDIRFTIRFSNADNGQIFDETVSHTKCASGLDFDEVNKVNVRNVRLGNQALRCEPHNPIRMQGESGMMVCTCENCIQEDQNAYWTVLEIDMSYGYKNVIRRDIELFSD